MGKTGTKRETSILILSSFSLDAQGEEGAQLPWDAQPSKITPNENDILTSPSKLSLHRISWTVDILKEAGKKVQQKVLIMKSLSFSLKHSNSLY